MNETSGKKLIIADFQTSGEKIITDFPDPEIEEYMPEGISIYITGTQLNNISKIEIYMKESEV